MTILIREVYDAFKEAGVSDETARNASEALTGYEDRFHHLERDMDRRFNEMELKMERRFNAVDQRFSKMEGTQRLLQWMAGFNLALTMAVFLLILRGGI